MNAEKINERNDVNGIRVVQDIEEAKKALKEGLTIARFEFGDSLVPFVYNGEYLKVVPLKEEDEIKYEDIVLCEVNGYLMTHMVLFQSGDKYMISSSNGVMFGYTDRNHIYGKCYPFGNNMEERVFYGDILKD